MATNRHVIQGPQKAEANTRLALGRAASCLHRPIARPSYALTSQIRRLCTSRNALERLFELNCRSRWIGRKFQFAGMIWHGPNSGEQPAGQQIPRRHPALAFDFDLAAGFQQELVSQALIDILLYQPLELM